jgi:glucarate dehydratase
MKIADIRTTVVTVPTLFAYGFSQGWSDGFTRTIIELVTDEGLTGLGEVPHAKSAQTIRDKFLPRIKGVRVEEIETARRLCVKQHNDFGGLKDTSEEACFAGIEIALWDIAGKRAGLPVYKVMGGAVRERALFGAYGSIVVHERDKRAEGEIPAIMAQRAKDAIKRSGANFYEYKIGRDSVECDIETTRAVRAALGPNVGLGVDMNMAYSMDQCRRYLDAVADCGLANLEEPVARLADLERIRRDFGIPVSSHCTDFEMIVHYPLIDGVVGDLHVHGGIAKTCRTAALAESHNKRFWLRSSLELGISWAAMCHFGVLCLQADRPGQALMDWIEDDCIEGEPWHVKNGGVRPPDRPGLGVELDRAAIAKYHEYFRKHGEKGWYEHP